jgi:hypothetical protein
MSSIESILPIHKALMSSPGFPTLNLDVSGRRAERTLAIAIVIAACAALSALDQPFVLVASAMLCTMLAIAVGFRSIGWMGGSERITRIACQPDGHWLLSDARGRVSDCVLSGASRVTPAAIWLLWAGRSNRPLLLLPGDLPADDFRRLVVCLRLGDRLIPGGTSNEP